MKVLDKICLFERLYVCMHHDVFFAIMECENELKVKELKFTHLQVHSGYSFYESTLSIEEIVTKAQQLHFEAIALTDHEVLYGVIPFYKACLAHGIKPIIGMSIDVYTHDEEERCILLAKNNKGYRQLMTLSTVIQTKDKTITLKELSAYTEDLICILPIRAKNLAPYLLIESYAKVNRYIEEWVEIFSKEDFYLGVEDHGLQEERRLFFKAKEFHEEYGFQAVAIQDVRYLKENDYIAYDCFRAMKKNKRWIPSSIETTIKNRHLRSTKEMEQLFAEDWPLLLEETQNIQEKCNVSFTFNQTLMPAYPTPSDLSSHEYLEKLCWKYAEEKYKKITPEIEERLRYELETIQKMGFSDYFLIVWDFVTYAKEKNVMVGPGRGSAAGSIVSYLLNITEVDPLKYGLLFERFLNPERLVMPDIDIDFSDLRRDEVIRYVQEKYGSDYVAQIITFGTFGSRSLLRELFKTIGVNQQDASYLLSYFSSESNRTLLDAIQQSEDLASYIKQSKQLRLLFKIALTLEGLPRHISTHAAGIVMSKKPLLQYTPLTKGSTGTSLTQYPMDALESLGLLKMDFLGLKNLTFLERILQAVKKEKHSIPLKSISLQDEKTFQLLQKGQTNGVFQLESQGMKNVLKALKPTTFEDLVVVNALYRPGPMDYIDVYIRRKHQKEKVSYIHPSLEPILKKTYGVLVYQEQMMEITHKVAGYSYGEADVFRRALEQPASKHFSQQKNNFLQNSIENGYSKEEAEKIFLWLMEFSRYSFNRSHAVAYSKISYWLAYFKANEPTYFFAELLNTVSQRKEKVREYLREINDHGIDLLPPSIHKSMGHFTVENHSIRMGLLAIKGLGPRTVEEIIQTRSKQPFTNFFDFCLRVSEKAVQRQELEILILAGVFDELHPNRASLLASIDQALEQRELFGDLYGSNHLLKGRLGFSDHYASVEDFSPLYKLKKEKKLLGIYISDHPLAEYRKKLTDRGYQPLINSKNLIGKRNVKSAALIQEMNQIQTKHGDPMAFLVIGDETMEIEAVVFPDLFSRVRKWLQEEEVVLIKGGVQERKDKLQWVLSSIEPFALRREKFIQRKLFIKVKDHQSPEVLSFIRQNAHEYPGHVTVYLYDETNGKTYQLASSYQLAASDTCLRQLKQYFGHENVVLTRKE